MPKIEFSHSYPKLHNQKSAVLLEVYLKDREDLSVAFVEYDTTYIIDHAIGLFSEETLGHYKLPEGRVLVLLFIGDQMIPFTTVRRYTPEKDRFYRENLRKVFDIIIGK